MTAFLIEKFLIILGVYAKYFFFFEVFYEIGEKI